MERPPSAPVARFDDLVSGRSLVLATAAGGPARTVQAFTLDQVIPVLRAVEQASADGLWAAGFVAYEAAGGLDPSLVTRSRSGADAALPLAWFALFDTASEEPAPRQPGTGAYECGPWRPDWERDEYAGWVQHVRDEIAEGRTYQCNLTVRLRAEVGGDLLSFYSDLIRGQESAYNAYLDTGRFVVASASPELFFEWTAAGLRAKPMKGTAPRGRWSEDDQQLADQLRASEKERAENVMIVDLIRNDLGKVAGWGEVAVPALFDVEQYPTLWTLTSTVTARPRPEIGLLELFRALFPCGSVTGAPKRQTMGLIADIERSPRGVYCGAVGLVAPVGHELRARFSVAIRTVVVDRNTGAGMYGTGGGITWDSDAGAEHAELLTKAAVLHADRADVSLLETMGFCPGEGIRHRPLHLRRLTDSARYFGIPLDPEVIAGALAAAVGGLTEPARVRLVVDRWGIPAVTVGAMPAATDRPVTLAVDTEAIDSRSRWLYHKTTRRDLYERRAASHPEADDVVLVNEAGAVTETTIANLAVCLDGQWWTPPVSVGCLPGVERGRLVLAGRLRERVLTAADLHRAERIALVSSLRGGRRPAVLAAGPARED